MRDATHALNESRTKVGWGDSKMECIGLAIFMSAIVMIISHVKGYEQPINEIIKIVNSSATDGEKIRALITVLEKHGLH